MGVVNGPPSEREHKDLVRRVYEVEKQVESLREWRARAHGIASVLGFIAGIISAAVVTAVVKAIDL